MFETSKLLKSKAARFAIGATLLTGSVNMIAEQNNNHSFDKIAYAGGGSGESIQDLSLIPDPTGKLCLNTSLINNGVFETPAAPAGTMQTVNFVVNPGTRLIISTGGEKFAGRSFSANPNEKIYGVFEAFEGPTSYTVDLPKNGYITILELNAKNTTDDLHSATLELAKEDAKAGFVGEQITRYNGWTGKLDGVAKGSSYVSSFAADCELPTPVPTTTPSPTPTTVPTPTVTPVPSTTPVSSPEAGNPAKVQDLPLLEDPNTQLCLNAGLENIGALTTPEAPAGTMQEVTFIVPANERWVISTGGLEFNGRLFSANGAKDKILAAFDGTSGATQYTVKVPKNGYTVLGQKHAKDTTNDLNSVLLKLNQEDLKAGYESATELEYNGWTGLFKGANRKLFDTVNKYAGLCVIKYYDLFIPANAIGNAFNLPESAPTPATPEKPMTVLKAFTPTLVGEVGPIDADESKGNFPAANLGAEVRSVNDIVGTNAFWAYDGGRVLVQPDSALQPVEFGYDKNGMVLILIQGGQTTAKTTGLMLNSGVKTIGSMPLANDRNATAYFARRADEILNKFKTVKPTDGLTLILGKQVNGKMEYSKYQTTAGAFVAQFAQK